MQQTCKALEDADICHGSRNLPQMSEVDSVALRELIFPMIPSEQTTKRARGFVGFEVARLLPDIGRVKISD